MADWEDKFERCILLIMWVCVGCVVVAEAIAVIIRIVRWGCG